jgi:hypothetical protein
VNNPTRFRSVRSALVALVALVVGGMLALGISAPAFAVATVAVTVKVVNKAGTAVPTSAVYPIEVADGVLAPGGADLPAASPVSGKPGYFSATLTVGQVYTLVIDPTGTSANNGTWEYLGGGEDLNEAQTFVPSSTNDFVTATFAAEGVITGKVTSPTGAVLKNAEADAFEFVGGVWKSIAYSYTGSTGIYTLTNLSPGSYKMKFFAASQNYPPVYSGESQTLDAASAVSITPGKTVTVNAKFVTFTGSMSGIARINYDGELFADVGAIASAYPVTTQSGGHAVTIDYGHAVSSAAVNSKGAWTISNLALGSYVIDIVPAYYNESAQWAGTDDPSEGLTSAALFTLTTAGQKLAVGETDLLANDFAGSQPEITVRNSTGTLAVSGAEVSLTSDSDGLEYLTGISGSSPSAFVPLTYGDGTPVNNSNLQPGWYTVDVIDPLEAHEPYIHDEYFGFGSSQLQVNLLDTTVAPGFSAQPTISQSDAHVGTTYTVAGEVAARGDASFEYQWLRSGKPIYGATLPGYTSTGADLDYQLSVRVTASSFGFEDVSTTAPAPGGVEIAGAAATNTDIQPSVSPSVGVYVGTTLQANVGTWSTTGLKFHYQWTSGTDTVGADSSTYVVAASDIDKPINVTVTATKTGYDDSDAVVSPIAVTPAAHPAPLNTKAPAITKTVSKGVTTYSATAGTWSVAGLTYTYQWTAGSADVSSVAKFSTSTPTWTDPLELTVTTMKTGYLPGTKTVIGQKGTSAFTETIAPVVHDARTGADIVDTDDSAQVGDTLTVTSPANWTVAGGVLPSSYAYQWYRQSTAPGKLPVAISGATKSTYVVSSTDVSQFLSVRETTVSSTYTAASVFAPAGIGAISPLLQSTPATVTVHGVAAQGQTLSAVVGAWPVAGVTTSYQWVDCPTAAATCTSDDPSTYLLISKATKSTLVASASYGNVAVRIIGSKAGYASETEFSAAASLVPATTVVNLTAPTISGTSVGAAHVGVKLTAVSGKFSVTGLAAHYEWQIQNCVPVACDPGSWTQATGAGSTASTYTPVPTDLGVGSWSVRVVETTSRATYTTTPDDSAAVALAAGTAKATKAPTLTTAGSTATGTFTVNPGTYTPVGGTSIVRWYIDGILANVDPGTSMPQLPRSDVSVGQAVYATTTYSAPGYNDLLTPQLIAQRGTLIANPETVTGAAYGDLLGISNVTPFTDAADTPVSLTYQWYSNGVAIKGATTSTFRPTTAYIAHHIQVKVTGSNSLYNALSTTTVSTFVLGTGGLGDLSQPTITFTGTLQPGTVMTGNPGTGYATTGYTIARQWQRSSNGGTSWVSISKATAATYTPAATDVGAEFRVQITSSKAGYGTQTQWSDGATVQFSPTLATLTPPVVTGTATVGSPLTASPGLWNTPTLTYAYQWYRDDVLIPGATAATFTPDYTDATDTLSFTVTASRVGYQPVTVTSNDQVIGLGTITATTAPKITLVSGKYTVSTGAWAVDGLTFGYQWQVAGVDATGLGANTDSYTRSGSDAGILSVVITVERTGYTTLTLTVNGPTLVALP